MRGILNRPDAQLVFVDTPGLHKPVTALGRKVNATAIDSVAESDAGVDVVCLVLDATAPFGSGDRWVAGHLDLPRAVVVVNKVDRASRDQVMVQLGAAGELGAEAYFPVSARTGRRARRARRAPRRAAARRARSSSRPTPCTTCPRSSGSPSSSASSCSP